MPEPSKEKAAAKGVIRNQKESRTPTQAPPKPASGKTNAHKIPGWLPTALFLVLFMGISLYFRVYLPHSQVFADGWVKFTSVDAYWHLRIIDNLLSNFPHLMSFDPYALIPEVSSVDRLHFYDWTLAGIIKIFTLGRPTESSIDAIAAYFPAVLGVLVVIPVYFIGKALGHRWIGLIAAGLVAVLPGEFMGRSVLGFTDHHVAESLFSAVVILFLMLALKSGRDRDLSYAQLKQPHWPEIGYPLLYAVLAGLSLGVYMITWVGSPLLIFIITLYFVIQFISDHVRRRSTQYVTIIGPVLFLIAAVFVAPFSPGTLYKVGLAGAVLIPIVVGGVSSSMTRKGLRPAYFPAGVLLLGLVGGGLFYLVSPSNFDFILSQFNVFNPGSTGTVTTLEMQGILFPNGVFSLSVIWGNFPVTMVLAVIALLILLYEVVKEGKPEAGLLLVWSLVMLAATLGQRRFAYYLSINVALLSGYFIWKLVSSMGFTPGAPVLVRTGKKTMSGLSSGAVAALVIILAALTMLFNISPAYTLAREVRFAPTDAWQSTLTWMKDNTPEPFTDSGYYYQQYDTVESFSYPASAYGVSAWWDYGYWITRIAHRIPNANPEQSPEPIINVARLFLAQDESSARDLMLKLRSQYIVMDYKTTSTIMWAIIQWAGREQYEFWDTYYASKDNKLVRLQLLYPEYYRALCTRLYNFNGNAVDNPKPAVVTYEDRISSEGQPYKYVTGSYIFSSYDEAVNYMQNQKGKARIVGTSPFVSPVSLEPLDSFRLAYSSQDTVSQPDVGNVPEVKVFERLK